MDCKRVKEIIPDYVNHSASQQDIQSVEEHLCICQMCRAYLSSFLDKEELFIKEAETPKEETVAKQELVERGPVSQEEKVDAREKKCPLGNLNQDKWDIFTYFILGLGLTIVLFLIVLFFKA